MTFKATIALFDEYYRLADAKNVPEFNRAIVARLSPLRIARFIKDSGVGPRLDTIVRLTV